MVLAEAGVGVLVASPALAGAAAGHAAGHAAGDAAGGVRVLVADEGVLAAGDGSDLGTRVAGGAAGVCDVHLGIDRGA